MISERNSHQFYSGGKFEQLLKSREDNGAHYTLLLKFIERRLESLKVLAKRTLELPAYQLITATPF